MCKDCCCCCCCLPSIFHSGNHRSAWDQNLKRKWLENRIRICIIQSLPAVTQNNQDPSCKETKRKTSSNRLPNRAPTSHWKMTKAATQQRHQHAEQQQQQQQKAFAQSQQQQQIMPIDSIHSIQFWTYLNTHTTRSCKSKNLTTQKTERERERRVKHTITYSIKHGKPQTLK